MKISAICFDLGKVLIDYDRQIMYDRIARKSSLPAAKIEELISTDPAPHIYEAGGMTSAKYFSHLKKILKYTGPANEIREAWAEIFTPMPEHIALAAALRPHYPLAIISNTNEAHLTYAESIYSFFSLFRARIYSYQIKALKPQPEIYRHALKALGGIDPLEALFIDDLEPNILGAVKLGWQTIHLRPEVNLREALASYELKGLD